MQNVKILGRTPRAVRQRHSPGQKLHILLICGALAGIFASRLLFAVLSMDLLAGARGYIQGESQWSKAEKDAVLYHHRYAYSRSQADYQHYLEAIRVPAACHQLRVELDRPQHNPVIVARSVSEAVLRPDDRDRMTWMYRVLRR